MEEEKKVVYTTSWGSTLCDPDDDSGHCRFQRFMFYVRSITFILILLYVVYFVYTEYAPKSLKSLFKSK